MKVCVLELYANGELIETRVYKKQKGAQEEASKRLHVALNDSQNDFGFAIDVTDHDEFLEFRDNMNALFDGGKHKDHVECYDSWVADGEFAGPTPFNFEISEKEVL